MKSLESLSLGTKLLLALTLAAAVFGVVSAVQAAIPDSSGVIHGCYPPSGKLRVIDNATAACKRNETRLDWNQTGPTGPAGPAGTQGAKGDTGATEPAGAPGPARTVLFAVIRSGCAGVLGGDATDATHPLATRCDVRFNRDLTGCKSDIQSTFRAGSWLMAAQTMMSTTISEEFGFQVDGLAPTDVAVASNDSSRRPVPVGSFGTFKLLVFCE
jgi:hypothetical protein